MLVIGREVKRNLQEQVGYLTGEVKKIWEALDGLDVYDNVIILEDLNPLTPAQLEIVNKPVAFIVYNNTLYMKRGVDSNKAYFDAVFQVSLGSGDDLGKIFFGSSEIVVNYPLGTLNINNLTTGTYGWATIDTLLALKADANNVYTKTEILAKTYPVGAIYISTDSTSPASLFGGTWEQIKDKFLLSAGDVYSAGTTGGNAQHNHLLEGFAKMTSYDNDIRWKYKSTEYYSTNWRVSAVSHGASENTTNEGIELGGSTEVKSNMPPYLTVYMWKRIA